MSICFEIGSHIINGLNLGGARLHNVTYIGVHNPESSTTVAQ